MKEAMVRMAECVPAILITDIEMPDGDGYAVLREVRQFEKNRDVHISVVALTAHSGEGQLLKIASAGFDAQLSRPLNAEKLLFTLTRFVSLKETSAIAVELPATQLSCEI